MIAGVDGCEDGWVAAIESADGERLVIVFKRFKDLVANAALKIIVVDIPIGLTARGPRLCDIETRRFIGPRGSSVFPAPLRPMLTARDWKDAARLRQTIEGKRCSK